MNNKKVVDTQDKDENYWSGQFVFSSLSARQEWNTKKNDDQQVTQYISLDVDGRGSQKVNNEELNERQVLIQGSRHFNSYSLHFENNCKEKTFNDLKDLLQKNPILTIYKPLQETELSSKYEESLIQLNLLISQSLEYLQNSEFIVNQKSSIGAPVKYALKPVITRYQQLAEVSERYFNFGIISQFGQSEFYQENIRILLQSISTLYWYIEEAIDRQFTGSVNNAIFLLQSKTIKLFNNFSSACWLYCINNEVKNHKFVFVNLSDEESHENLELWIKLEDHNKQLQNQNAFQYFSLDQIIGEKECDSFISLAKKYNSNKIILLPYICNNNILTHNLSRILFGNFCFQKIEAFHPDVIGLNIKISSLQKYEPEALQYLITELSRLCFNKLLIHLDFDIDSLSKITDNQEKLTMIVNIINICFQSYSVKNDLIQYDFTEMQDINFYSTLRQIFTLYQKSGSQQDSRMIGNTCNIQINYLSSIFELYSRFILQPNKKEVLALNHNQQCYRNAKNVFNVILFKKSYSCKLINVLLSDADVMDEHSRVQISYEDNIIIIYQETYSVNDKEFIYYIDLTDKLHSSKVDITLQFTKISLPFNYAIYQYKVYYHNNKLLLIYGKNSSDEFHDVIYEICKNQFQSGHWKKLPRQQQQMNMRDESTITFQARNETQEDRKKFYNLREGATICSFSQDDQTSKLLLIGGENCKYSDIMNTIEELELTENNYSSFFVKKEQIFQQMSFKPSRDQCILESALNQNDMIYLFLPSNDHLRRYKFHQPINNQQQKETILLRITKKIGIKFEKISITYCNNQYYPLDQLLTSQKNQQLLKHGNESVIWRVICIQLIKPNELIELKPNYSYSSVVSDEFNSKCEVQVENIESFFDIILQKPNLSPIFYNSTLQSNRHAIENEVQVVAIENYIRLDLVKKQILVKQFAYELREPVIYHTDSIANSIV